MYYTRRVLFTYIFFVDPESYCPENERIVGLDEYIINIVMKLCDQDPDDCSDSTFFQKSAISKESSPDPTFR